MKRWMSIIEPAVLSMASLRLLSAAIELTAAILMLVFNDVKKAVVVNAFLAMFGPIIFVITMTIGLLSLADELSFSKLLLVAIGVTFILVAIYK